MEVSGQFQAPAALPPGKVARYPLNRRLGLNGPGKKGNLLLLQGFELRTVQPTASRNTHCALPAPR